MSLWRFSQKLKGKVKWMETLSITGHFEATFCNLHPQCMNVLYSTPASITFVRLVVSLKDQTELNMQFLSPNLLQTHRYTHVLRRKSTFV